MEQHHDCKCHASAARQWIVYGSDDLVGQGYKRMRPKLHHLPALGHAFRSLESHWCHHYDGIVRHLEDCAVHVRVTSIYARVATSRFKPVDILEVAQAAFKL